MADLVPGDFRSLACLAGVCPTYEADGRGPDAGQEGASGDDGFSSASCWVLAHQWLILWLWFLARSLLVAGPRVLC